MPRQGVGTVWHFDTYDDLQDTTGIDGVFGHVIGTDGVKVDATYLWIDGPGWIVLWGDTPTADQFGASSDAIAQVLYWRADSVPSRLAATDSPLARGDRMMVDLDDELITTPMWQTPARWQDTPSDPTGTNSTAGVMMGLAASITPLTQRILVLVSGDIQNSSGSGGGTVQIRYGTGAAPANGNALTGTAIGGQPDLTQAAVASNKAVPFALNAIEVVGITAGETYWIDVSLAALNTGTASIKNVSISALDF